MTTRAKHDGLCALLRHQFVQMETKPDWEMCLHCNKRRKRKKQNTC